MSKIQNAGYAYQNLLPLCAVDENGTVDRELTLRNIHVAIVTYEEVKMFIPEAERENVRHQIEGALQSWIG